MSNQVYSNPSSKYYGQNGISMFANAPQTVNAGTGARVLYTGPPVIAQADLGNVSSINGVFTANIEGMYAIEAYVSMTRTDANADWDYRLTFLPESGFAAATGISLAIKQNAVPRIPGSTREMIDLLTMTTFLPAGSTFSIFLNNNDVVGGHNLSISTNLTRCVFTKIA